MITLTSGMVFLTTLLRLGFINKMFFIIEYEYNGLNKFLVTKNLLSMSYLIEFFGKDLDFFSIRIVRG